MPYVIRTWDKPDSGELRAASRPAHLAYLTPFASRILAAGALLDEAGTTPAGSLIVLDTEDRDEAQRLVDDDPYTHAGLFERVEILRWRMVFFDGNLLP